MHLVHVLARGAVHDAAVQGVIEHVRRDARKLALRLQTLHAKRKVRPIEPGHRLVRIAQIEQPRDVGANARRSRSGERRHNGPLRQLGDEIAHGQIRRAEVLPPLRHAVGLVHRNERDAGLARELDETGIGQALGRNVHDLVRALERAAQHGCLLARRKRGVEVRAPNSRLDKGAHLIAHERHERAYHQGQSAQHDARHLVAHRFSRARRHDCKRVAPG